MSHLCFVLVDISKISVILFDGNYWWLNGEIESVFNRNRWIIVQKPSISQLLDGFCCNIVAEEEHRLPQSCWLRSRSEEKADELLYNWIKIWEEDWTCKRPSVRVSAGVWQRRFSAGLLGAPQVHPAERVSGRAAVLRRPGEQQPAQVGLSICMSTGPNVVLPSCLWLMLSLCWTCTYISFWLKIKIFLHIKFIKGNTVKVYDNYFPPGACVSTPSSSSLMKTQTGNWALMSFSTA